LLLVAKSYSLKGLYKSKVTSIRSSLVLLLEVAAQHYIYNAANIAIGARLLNIVRSLSKLNNTYTRESRLCRRVLTKRKTKAIPVTNIANYINNKASIDSSSTGLLSSYCLQLVRRNLKAYSCGLKRLARTTIRNLH
jgi:hypothetical protein